jgi:hypothetical protein
MGGSLLQYSNGQSLTGSYKSPTLSASNIGIMGFNFTSPTTAIMQLPNGQSVPLQRFAFNTNIAEGLYQGTSSTGYIFESLFLENDQFYVLYGNYVGATFYIKGFVQGDGVSNNGQFTSNDVVDFGSLGVGSSGVMNASYTAGQSFNGTISRNGQSVTFASSHDLATLYVYGSTPRLSDIVGNWSLTDLSGLPVTLVVNSDGTYSANQYGCISTGKILPRASGKNVFDINGVTGSSNCNVPNMAFSGIAVEYPLANGGTQLIVAGTDPTREFGTAYVGMK